MTAFQVNVGVDEGTGDEGAISVAFPGAASAVSNETGADQAPAPEGRHARTCHCAVPMASKRFGATTQVEAGQTCSGSNQNSFVPLSASVTDNWYQMAPVTGLHE